MYVLLKYVSVNYILYKHKVTNNYDNIDFPYIGMYV